MPGWMPLAVTTAMYLWQAGNYGLENRPAMLLCFVGYALANVGLIWDFISHG